LVLAGIALFGALRPRSDKSGSEKSPEAPKSVAPAAGSAASPARELAARALATAGDMTASGPALFAALKDAERAVAMDESDGELWAATAAIELALYERWIDHSDARRESTHAKLVKAKGLAPHSARTRFAEAKSFIRFDPTATSLAAALEILQGLRRENPAEVSASDILGMIGVAQQEQGNFDEAARSLELAGPNWANAASWACLLGGNLDQGLAMAERQVTVDPVNGVLQVAIVQFSRGDRAAQQAALGRLPAAARLEETARSMDLDLAYVGRDAEALLKAARAFPTAYISNFTLISRPRGYYTGLAYAWMGRAEAARTEWNEALRLVETTQGTDRTADELTMARLYLLAQLGRTEEAGRELKGFREREHEFWVEPPIVGLLALLGRTDEALDEMERQLAARPRNRWLAHSRFRSDPELDSLRTHPRFHPLLRKALLAGAKPLDEDRPELKLPAATTEARRLAITAFAITTDSIQTPDRLRAAMEMAEKATTLDPLDGEVWALGTLVDLSGFEVALDSSERRRDQIRIKLAKAKGLAPQSDLTRFAEAKMFLRVDPSPESVAAGIELLRRLPAAKDVRGMLGVALQQQGKFDEAARTLSEVGWINAAGWAYLEGRNLAGAAQIAEQQMTSDPVAGAVQLAWVAFARADLAAMQAALDRVPLTSQMEETVLSVRLNLCVYRRDGAGLLRVARMLPAEFNRNGFLYAPRGYFVGLAQQGLGNADAARAEWTNTLRQVEERLAAQPEDTVLRYSRLFLLAGLGRIDEVDRDLRVLRQRDPDDSHPATLQLLATLGRREDAIDVLGRVLRPSNPALWYYSSDARFNPCYDSLRDDPRFEQLLRETLPKGAKPLEDKPKADK
jgi:tetratricopeptide (TPR) repeat protein